MRIGIGIGLWQLSRGASAVTVLVRQPDGTVQLTTLGPTWAPTLTRQPDGTVTVGA